MRFLARPLLWLRALVSRRQVEDEMSREMRFHLEMETERLVQDGIPADEARRRALVSFGGVERYKEAVRDERGFRSLDAVGAELRLAVRGLAAHPAFAAVVVLTIAIGIGATTAVYSWADWALFRPVPGVRDPSQMVSIGFQTAPDAHGAIMPTGISYPNFIDLRNTTHAFAGLAGYSQETGQLAVAGADPMELTGAVVLGNYFGVLGVTPRLGRAFTAAELAPTADAAVVVISDSIWRTTFGGARDVLGRHVKVNSVDFTVIGVAPPAFRGTERSGDFDLWFPPSAFSLLRHHHYDLTDRGNTVFEQLIGRLRPGITPAVAQNELNRRLAILVAAYPGINDVYKKCHAFVNADLGMETYMRAGLADTVRMVLVVVALILLISCANVANLLLLRGSQRREAMAVRRALGASGRRVLGQYVSEGLVLALAGALLGFGVAVLLAQLFGGQTYYGTPRYAHLLLDRRVLTVAVAVTLATGVLFGLAPAVSALRDDPMRLLKEGAGRQSARRAPMRASLTVAQVGAATALVVGALLLARTLHDIGRVDLGFDGNHVSTFYVDARPQGFPPARMDAIRREMLARASALPGVEAAAIATSLPALGAYMTLGVHLPQDTAKRPRAMAISFTVSADYFRALHIPIVRGASFSPGSFDDTTSREVIVSVSLARTLFGHGDPIGQQIITAAPGDRGPKTIVGVVGDIRPYGPLQAVRPAVYLPSAGGPFGALLQSSFVLAIRSPRSPAAVRQEVKMILASVSPEVPLPTAEPLSALVDRLVSGPRLFIRLIGVLAVIAMTLAAIGLYSVIAFTVAERTREIGIRMALGAYGGAVVGLVARQSARLVAVGLLIGVGGAYVLARLLTKWLYGVGPLDPASYAGAAIVWVLLALAASVVPARAATRVDPTIAMRAE